VRELDAEPTIESATDTAGLAVVEPTQSPRWAHRSQSGRLYPGTQEELAPAAKRLLEAARKLLSESGFGALKLQRIADVAGERKSLIHYYFGGKNGFLVALLDWLFDDTNRDIRARVAALPMGEERLKSLVADLLQVSADRTANREYFELLPHVLANADMRRRLADLYVDYGAMVQTALPAQQQSGLSEERLAGVSRLVIALVEGYAIQLLADPRQTVGEADLRLWEQFLGCLLTPEQSHGEAQPVDRGSV
jgi:AcrR family transcriptional regulator